MIVRLERQGQRGVKREKDGQSSTGRNLISHVELYIIGAPDFWMACFLRELSNTNQHRIKYAIS